MRAITFRVFAVLLLATFTPIEDASAQSGFSVSSATATVPHPISDCDDTNPSVHPGATEIAANGIDENCNGLADEAPDGMPSGDSSDSDSDGISIAQGDCNDHNPAVHPGATEIVGDLLDNDCDGLADEDSLGNPSSDMTDHDGDGLPMRDDRIFYGGFE